MIAAIIIAVVIVSALAYMWWSPQEGSQGETQTDWYFKGAYATYEGEDMVASYPRNISMRIEVIDLNNTHFKSLLYMKMTMQITPESSGTIFDEQYTNWVPKKEITYFVMPEMEGIILRRTYENHVYIEGIGTKYCKIYEFASSATIMGANTSIDIERWMTIYVDPDIMWPLKFSIRTEEESLIQDFDLTLTDTNIPDLN